MGSLIYRTIQLLLMGIIGLAVLLNDVRQRIRGGRGAFRLPEVSRIPVFLNDCLFWISVAVWVVIGLAWFIAPESIESVLPVFVDRLAWLMPFGILAGLMGLFYIIGGIISLGSSFRTSIDYREKTKLVTSGMYRICRHPMALGLLLQGWATALMVQTWPALAMAICLHATNRLRIHFEERYLTAILGEDYQAFRRRTGRFFPRFGR